MSSCLPFEFLLPHICFPSQNRVRETANFKYQDKLKEKYASHPQVKRIARHRHVPKHVFNGRREIKIMLDSQKRKYVLFPVLLLLTFFFLFLLFSWIRETNRRINSKPGSVPFVPEKKKRILSEDA